MGVIGRPHNRRAVEVEASPSDHLQCLIEGAATAGQPSTKASAWSTIALQRSTEDCQDVCVWDGEHEAAGLDRTQ